MNDAPAALTFEQRATEMVRTMMKFDFMGRQAEPAVIVGAVLRLAGEERPEWRCFRCGEVFTDRQEAAAHFGIDEGEPACKLNQVEGLLVKMLFEAQQHLDSYRQEDSAVLRAMADLSCRHGAALRDEEEKGYAKGLKDGQELVEAQTNEGLVWQNRQLQRSVAALNKRIKELETNGS